MQSIPGTNSWARFDIPTSTIIDIKAGSIYWWGIYAVSGAQEGHYYAVRFDKDNGYNGGLVTNWSSLKRIWVRSLDFDNLFRIYGDVAEVTPVPTASTSSSETSCVIPAVIAGIVSGLVAAAIAGVFAYRRGVAKGINRQTSQTQQKSSTGGFGETIETGEKADTDEEEQKKSITLTMSCRIKNQISGEETYTERRIN